jgi:hypothetical protein
VYSADPDILLRARDLNGSTVAVLIPLVVECGEAILIGSQDGAGVNGWMTSSLVGVSTTLGGGATCLVRLRKMKREVRYLTIFWRIG